MILKNQKQKRTYSFLSIQTKHYTDSNGSESVGVYDGKIGTVRIFVCTRDYKNSDPNKLPWTTQLSYVRDGIEYTRIYSQAFRDRGLMLVCAKFLKDVKAGKVK